MHPDSAATPPPAVAPAAPPLPAEQVADSRLLYERIGGAVLRKVVEDLVAAALADPRVNFARTGHLHAWEVTGENVARVTQRVVEFLSVVTGAEGARYDGRDMVTAHEGMNITGGEFDAFVVHLGAALDRQGVRPRERRELIETVESTRAAVVKRAGGR